MEVGPARLRRSSGAAGGCNDAERGEGELAISRDLAAPKAPYSTLGAEAPEPTRMPWHFQAIAKMVAVELGLSESTLCITAFAQEPLSNVSIVKSSVWMLPFERDSFGMVEGLLRRLGILKGSMLSRSSRVSNPDA